MEDKQLIIAFYDDKRGRTFTPNVLKPGYTMAFLYPELHYFLDGQTGIRVEQSDIDQGRVKILPYTMDTLLKANDQIWKKKDSSECQKCQKKEVAPKKCARCKSAMYCDKVCLPCLDARI
jgi:hypothetical protein